MKLSKVMVGLAVAGSIGYATFAYAAGYFQNWPIVGSASYCGGTSNSAAGTIIGTITGCPNTVPAGPTALTGSEKFPADTGLASGINPQTVLVTPAALNALPYSYVTVTLPPSGFSATNVMQGVIFESAATITSANVSLPPSPIDNQTFAVCSNRTITTLGVLTGAGTQSFATNTTPTALTASTTAPECYRFVFQLSGLKWYRLQ